MSCPTNHDCVIQKAETSVIEVSLCFCDLLSGSESLVIVQWETSSDLSEDPNGIAIVRQNLPLEGDTVSALVGGGEAGKTYSVCATVDTSAGQRDRSCALITVVQCP